MNVWLSLIYAVEAETALCWIFAFVRCIRVRDGKSLLVSCMLPVSVIVLFLATIDSKNLRNIGEVIAVVTFIGGMILSSIRTITKTRLVESSYWVAVASLVISVFIPIYN
jgi:hypothetical protein